MAEHRDHTETEREAAIVAAYLAGKKITEIEESFGVGRSTIFHYLRRANKVPNRAKRQLDADSKDAVMAGLYDLISHQDRRIAEDDDIIAELRKRLAAAEGKATRAERKAARLQASINRLNGAASKPSRAG